MPYPTETRDSSSAVATVALAAEKAGVEVRAPASRPTRMAVNSSSARSVKCRPMRIHPMQARAPKRMITSPRQT